MSTHYELLGVPVTASTDDIKQAFRRHIARYHPDKVQHLGEEFQRLAEARSSQLTIAYKTLIDPQQRAAYDETLAQGPAREPAERRSDAESDRQGAKRGDAASQPPPEEQRAQGERLSFDAVRQGRDALLKRAVLAHVDGILRKALPQGEQRQAAGFDLGYLSRPRLFGSPQPWVLARFVPRLDCEMLQEIWTQAVRLVRGRSAPVCVLALAPDLAAEPDLAAVISANRRRPHAPDKVTVVPVDVRDWHAWIPLDADPAVRSVARMLRTG